MIENKIKITIFNCVDVETDVDVYYDVYKDIDVYNMNNIPSPGFFNWCSVL